MAAEAVHGALELIVDDKQLSAGIKFFPDEEGSECSAEDLKAFLREQGVRQGIDEKAVSEAAEKFSKGESRKALLLATGKAPRDPAPPQYEWEDLPIPEDLRYDSSLALENAPPEIYQTRIEKVKRQKKVLKKPLLPFLPAKEKTLEVLDKIERREKVYVDPQVISSGWCEKGTQIGSVRPGKPGSSGLTVFGQVIPAKADNSQFYCGEGITQEKGVFIARESGFFRRGENWIDLVPYTRHQWDVSLSKDHNTCYLDFNPGFKETAPPAASDIISAAQELGYPKEKLLASQDIQNMITAALKDGKALKKQGISVDEDGWFVIRVSDDKLKAFLSMHKRRGAGKPLVLKQVGAAIVQAGFKGLDKGAVQTAIMEFYRGPEAELRDYVLAEGKAPTADEDESFSLKVTCMAQADMSAISERMEQLSRNGSINLESWGGFPAEKVEKMAMVRGEQLVGGIVQGKKGDPGFDVYGARLNPPAGKKAPLHIYEGLRIEKNLIVAEYDGALEIGGIEGTTCLRLHPHKSAFVSVRISEDRMKAILSVSPVEGTGFPATEQGIREALGKAGVSRGINDDLCSKICEAAFRGEKIADVVVAEGNPPRDAGRVEVKFAIDFASGKGVTISKTGQANYRSQDRMTTVAAGDLIAEVMIPQGESEPGWDVTGKTLNARELKQIPLEAGENVDVREEEQGITRFYAAASGELIQDKSLISVRNTYIVAGDVGMKTGNIKFSGPVQIKGSVMPGFVVFSTGDVQVGGLVDASLVSAEGSIFVGHGVKGGGKAVLRSKKNVVAGFIEQAHVMAVGDIIVKNSCLRSSLHCNGRLMLKTDKGNLNGGIVKARQGAEVQNLGNPNGAKTQVSFGQDYLVADRIQVEEKEISRTREKVIKLDSILNRLEKAGEEKRLHQARHEKLKFIKLIEKRSLRLFTLREKYEEHYPSEVVVRGSLYPGVIFESHGRYYEVDKPQSGVVVFFDSRVGKIQQKMISTKE
ncbi:flagellar assembly protein A [Marispirochaeta sp.]|uniref:flagellar assembly protein A n=1 Tax=Marispirochaeta sp. TaxID=2038653 RepID=UPI0029C92E73|nr:flagellar assembly protein A [Marispirochaeta sp.]